MNHEPKPILKLEFGADTVWLVAQGSRPYVPLKPLCENLAISYPRQWARVHLRADLVGALTVKALDEDGQTMALPSIPLENLSWFLLTLAPRIRDKQPKIRHYKAALPNMLLYYWFRRMREYSTPQDFMRHFKATEARARPGETELRRRGRARSMDEATQMAMRAARDAGKSNSQIAREMGWSPATVSLVLKGKYPMPKKEPAESGLKGVR